RRGGTAGTARAGGPPVTPTRANYIAWIDDLLKYIKYPRYLNGNCDNRMVIDFALYAFTDIRKSVFQ
ncbi:MAG TPA: hypothetical protein VFR27_10460, partial [Mycobacterium sp.]|nr:hypothetical protein [Mycobacterium sp.]